MKLAQRLTLAKPRVTERQIQETCSAFLALDGWRRVRTDLAHLRGMGVQEKGMADDLYIRYRESSYCSDCGAHIFGGFGKGTHVCAQCSKRVIDGFSETLWIEYKRRTGKVASHQHAWHAQERARGALTLIAGIDFIASPEGFMDWYFNSGLARKVKDKRKA